MLELIYQALGQIALIIIIALFLGCLLTIGLGKILLKRDILIIPKFVLWVMDSFYLVIKKLSVLLGFSSTLIDHISVEIRNKLNENQFNKIESNNKALVLPHCLRNPKCPAVLGESGLVCTECNKCSIGIIKPKAESIGYKVFIIPGSTFAKKIAKKYEFEAVVGVACYQDLNLSMSGFSNYSPQGIVLSRDGCYMTQVDVEAVLTKIGYYKDKIVNMPKNSCYDTEE